MLQSAYVGVGSITPKGKVAGTAAFNAVRNASSPAGMRGPMTTRGPAALAARRNAYMQAGKTPTRLAIGAGLIGTSTAMRPNSNESRTSYRGPMQTGRGSGRYA